MAFNFEQLKGLFSTIKDKGAAVAGVAADKTKDAARIARLTMDINTEKSGLEKAFLELGKTYYEESKDSAQGLAAQLCAEISAINGRIESIQSEIDSLKDSFKPAEEPGFDEVVSAEEPCECCEEATCDNCETAEKAENDCCRDESKAEADCCADDKAEGDCCCSEDGDITVEVTEEPCCCEGEEKAEGDCCKE